MTRQAGQKEEGSALVSSLLLVALMSILALAMTTDLRFALRRTDNVERRDQAHWYALGARDYSETLLLRALERPEAAFRPDAPWLGQTRVFELESGRLAGRIHDAQNCFNLNGLVVPNADGRWVADPLQISRFEILLRTLGLSAGPARQISAGAADWIDSDGHPRASGAEDPAYERADRLYRTANRLMQTRQELRAVLGVDPELFNTIEAFVCARPDNRALALNLNTLTPDQAPLLVAALDGGLTRSQMTALLLARPAGGYAQPDVFWSEQRLASLDIARSDRADLGVTSRFFEIRIDVELDGLHYRLAEQVEHISGRQLLRHQQRHGMAS